MRKNYFIGIVAILGLFVLAIGCEKNSGRIINTSLTRVYVINSKDLLKITLGYFGDKEGVQTSSMRTTISYKKFYIFDK